MELKSLLTNQLFSVIITGATRSVDVHIFDAAFTFLRCSNCDSVSSWQTFVFLQIYKHQLIKDITREDSISGKGEVKVLVSGPEQCRPKYFNHELKSESFMISLLRLLAEELC